MLVSIASREDFHTQRNNVIDPANTCNVTAMVNALLASGIQLPPYEGQPEDALAKILDSPEAHEKLARDYPQMAAMPPREVHALLSWATNEKFLKRKVTTFASSISMNEILYRVFKFKCASVISTTMTRGGHLVTVSGFSSTQRPEKINGPGDLDLTSVRRVYLLDSWGDWASAYEPGCSGFNVAVSIDELMAMAKPISVQRKWAHIISPTGVF